jgi:hypothetical protein
MPMPCHLTIEGEKQGKIEGSCEMQGRGGSILVYELQHNVHMPRDPHSGLPSGKRVHDPFTIVKQKNQQSNGGRSSRYRPLRQSGTLLSRKAVNSFPLTSECPFWLKMSPLQYQKTVRLNEARRLMLAEHLNAATAAFQVGHESPSQFSREYRRMFGLPPL